MNSSRFLHRLLVSLLWIFNTGLIASQSVEEHQEANKRYATYLMLAEKYSKKLQYDSASTYCDSAILLARQLDNNLLYSYALRRKGSILKEDQKVAEPILIQAINISREYGYDSVQAASLLLLGIIQKSRGKSDSIMFFYQSALDIFQKTNDSLGIAEAYNHLALWHSQIGEQDNALKFLFDSYEIQKAKKASADIIPTLINLGAVYEKLNKLDTAISCYRLAYELSIQLDDVKHVSISLENQGGIFYKKKSYELSLDAFKEVIALNEKVENTYALITLYSKISLVYRALNRKEEAMKAVKKSLELAESADNLLGQLRAMNNLAIYNKWDKNYIEAEKYYLQSLSLSRQGGYLLDERRVLKNLSTLYEATGDLTQSLDYYKKYDVIKDSLMDEKRVQAIAELEAKYEKKADEAKILKLRNESAQKELEKKDIRLERNTILGSSLTLVLILSMGLFIYRYRLKKNKIISEQKFKQLEDEKNLAEAQSVILGQENERKRIAQELHDGIGVLISTAKMHFSNVIKSVKNEQTKTLIQQANKLLKDAGEEVRGISHNMMPGVLSKFGLADAIEDLLDELDNSGEFEIVTDLKALEERLSENTEIMLFRVVQEMVNNTLKYARATEITLSAKKKEGSLFLQYSDNGKGFNVDKIEQDKSLGISGIRSRINFLGGKVNIESSPGKGSSLSISVPLSG